MTPQPEARAMTFKQWYPEFKLQQDELRAEVTALEEELEKFRKADDERLKLFLFSKSNAPCPQCHTIDTAFRFICLEEENAKLRILARDLVGRLQFVHAHESYKSVWTLHQNHFGQYKGPTYASELEALRAALLSSSTGGKK